MKKIHTATADFRVMADTLTNEAFHGGIHSDIAEGLTQIDPFIGDYAPVFFVYTFFGHLYSAQMYACKLFDTDKKAVTVAALFEIAQNRATKFGHATEKEVRKYIDDAKKEIGSLKPTIDALRERRNNFLAHISPSFALDRATMNLAKLQIPEIRNVIYTGGRVVNGLLRMWCNCTNQLKESHSDDYKRVVEKMSKQICAEIQAHEKEFARYGGGDRLPRPKGCL